MEKLGRPLSIVSVLIIVCFLAVVYIQRKGQVTPQAQREAQFAAEEERIIGAIARSTMSASEIVNVPSYTDFTRELQRGVEKIVRARDDFDQTLDSNYNLLVRYPPEGIPNGYRGSYLRQNEAWRLTCLKGTNAQTTVIKNVRADLEAFFLSHPDDQSRMASKLNAAVEEALAKLKPGVGYIRELADAREDAVRNTSVATLARYESARLQFDRWRENL